MAILIYLLSFAIQIHADPLRDQQWALNNQGKPQPYILDDVTTHWLPATIGMDLGVPNFAPRPKKIKVAVLDTGLDLTHPEFSHLINRKPTECHHLEIYKKCLENKPSKGCDDLKVDSDNNGYALDCTGWDAALSSALVTDLVGHGTHVSGIIAASKNKIGIEGISQNIELIPVRVLGTENSPIEANSLSSVMEEKSSTPLTMEYVERGLIYALKEGAQVINLSLGWPHYVDKPSIRTLIHEAQKKGVIFVAGAGNDATDAVTYPCGYPQVICVGAVNPNGDMGFYSNRGYRVDLYAPGTNILSTWPLSKRTQRFTDYKGYDFKSGSSMAAPMVTALLAELLAYGYDSNESKLRILQTRSDSGIKIANWKSTLIQPPPFLANLRLYDAIVISDLTTSNPKSIDLPIDLTGDDSKRFEIQVKLVSRENPEIPFNEITVTASSEVVLKKGHSSLIPLTLSASGELLGSEALIEITLSSQNFVQRLLWPLVFVRSIEAMTQKEEAIVYPLNNGFWNINKLVSIDRKHLASTQNIPPTFIERQGSSLTLYQASDSGIRETAKTSIQHTGEFIFAQFIDYFRNGEPYLALGFQISKEKQSIIQIEILDMNLRTVKSFSHNQERAFLDPDFVWTVSGSTLTPTWVALGPPAVKESLDPWDPNKKPIKKLRIYYLGENGNHLLEVPLNLDTQIESESQVEIQPLHFIGGELIVSSGDNHFKKFYLTKVANGKFDSPQPILMSKYTDIWGFRPTPLFLGDQSSSKHLHAIYQSGVHHLNLKSPDFHQHSKKFDLFYPERKIISGSLLDNNFEFFSLSSNRLIFHGRNGIVSTDTRRFSYLSGYQFDASFFGILLKVNDEPLPSVYVPAGLDPSNSIQIIAPLAGLKRLAKFRIGLKDGCREMDPLVSNGAPNLALVCKDKLYLVPLRMSHEPTTTFQ